MTGEACLGLEEGWQCTGDGNDGCGRQGGVGEGKKRGGGGESTKGKGVGGLTCADWGGRPRLGEGVAVQVWQAGRGIGVRPLPSAAEAL